MSDNFDTQYDNTNSGAMFVNERKTTERHPDRQGNADIKCPHCQEVTPYWVSGWLKKAKRTGQTFMSLAFTVKEDKPAVAPVFDDEDVPF